MAYDHIQPAAFVPDPAAGPFRSHYCTLAFPAHWRGPILELYRRGKGEQTQARIKQVPIRRLNVVMRTLAPDLVSVDANASFDEDKPWLYADDAYPQVVMNAFLHAWLHDMQPSPEAYPLLKETLRKLNADELHWTPPRQTDLLELTLSQGGTAEPAPHLFRLLPEVLAERIALLAPYEHDGVRISFRRVAIDGQAHGAELMSWPPLPYETKAKEKDDDARAWYYCGVIRISVRTAPFSPIPRVHLGVGIRRWVSGPLWMPARRGVSVYLLADNPLVPDGLTPKRFAVAKLVWDYHSGKTRWAQGGPEGMLVRLSALDNLPPADVLAKEPEAWISGKDGLTAAVAYHTMMGWHPVGAGVMPSERRRLVEWAAQALEPDFKPVDALRRTEITPQNPMRVLERNLPVPREAEADERAAIAAVNQQKDLRNAEQRRARVALAVGVRGLTALLLYQTKAMRDQLVAAAEDSLGLSPHRVEAGPSTWSWRAPDLVVRIHAHRLGTLGEPLGGDEAPRRGEEQDAAIAQRRTEVAAALAQLTATTPDPAQIVFVELDGKQRFRKRTSDPKFAIRLGCVDGGMVSQFLQPPDQDARDKDDSAFRAAAAWADGLRQIGVRFVPEHTLGDAIPQNLNQVASWMVKRHAGPTNRSQFTPVAVLIKPGQPSIMGRIAGMSGWVPYPELLKNLAGTLPAEELKTKEQQITAAAVFIRTTLYGLRAAPTLVVTHAQNTRYRWPWLQNPGLVADRIQLGSAPLQRITLYNRQLRIARVATGDRDETAEWWAPKPNQAAGFAKNLWLPANADETNRVFYSTTDKASTHKLSVDATKLTPHRIGDGDPKIDADKNAWNPDLLEFTMVGLQPKDVAEQWAMYLHQQRFSDDYRDGLALPLILHLAQLASHYALPHEDVELLSVEAGAETTDQADVLTREDPLADAVEESDEL
jgi:hypothetical protein